MPDSLAGEFPAATREQWQQEVRRVLLKGAPEATHEDFERAFQSRLVTLTDDGIALQPLYTSADAPQTLPAPGQAPFLRGTRSAPRPWEVRQRVWPSVAGSSAVRELESGATGIWLVVDADDVAATVATGLEGVLLDLAPVTLEARAIERQVPAAHALLAQWSSIAADARQGCLGLDPLGAWARSGGAFDLAAAVDAVSEVVADAGVRAPSARVVVVDGSVWHEAGATEAQELAWTLASGAWIVRELVTRGVDLARAAQVLEFRLAATDDQFLTIAKLRAARVLWARILEVAGLPDSERAMRLHAEGSRVMLTRYDTWVNALRSTIACFAAGVGGADVVTVLPHDILLESGGSSLGRRIARNTQTILQMESHLDRVLDPAGGSWFVESLTRDLEERAWALVQASEAAGGIVAMLTGGTVHGALATSRAARQAQVAKRRRPLTGLSEFPNIDDPIPAPIPDPAVPGLAFEPLVLHRLGEELERQRARADAAEQSSGRPTLYLATLGTPAQATARATYAKNLFEAAGIRTVAGPVDDFAASGARVACLCSADTVYAEAGEQAAREMRAAGATRIYLAGRGAGVPGVDEEVGLGCDVLDVLGRALDELGVAR